MANSKAFISAISVMLFLSACSETKKLDQMHDSTQEMNQTTSEMNQTTSQMNKTTSDLNGKTSEMNKTTQDLDKKTEDMKNMTNELYDALRQGDALQLRQEAWKEMMKASTMFKKLSEAGKYFMSFEVQLWNQFGEDSTVEKRDSLSQQAAREFFLEVEDLAPRDNSVNVTVQPDAANIQSAANRTACFNVIAAEMHEVNRKQATSIAGTNLPMVSMESLMEDALLAKPSIQDGTAKLGTKEGYIREVLAHEEKAIQILQTRYNFFQMMFIDAITQVSSMNTMGQLKMAGLGWDLDLDQLSVVKMNYYKTELLDRAVQAREMLKKIGVKPVMDPTVARLLSVMRVKTAGTRNATISAQQTQMTGVLQDLQKNQ